MRSPSIIASQVGAFLLPCARHEYIAAAQRHDSVSIAKPTVQCGAHDAQAQRSAMLTPAAATRKRIVAIVLALALLAPSLFIVAEAHHDCAGDGCEVCHALAIAVSIAHESADVPTATATAALVLFFALLSVTAPVLPSATTLVGLKVRLDC